MFGWYSSPGTNFLSGNGWRVSPGSCSFVSSDNWQPTDLVVSNVPGQCPEGTTYATTLESNLPKRLTVCGSSHEIANGEYELIEKNTFRHVNDHPLVELRWWEADGRWEIRNIPGMLHYSSHWDLGSAVWSDGIIVSSAGDACNLPEELSLCDGEHWDVNGSFLKQIGRVNGAPFYKSDQPGNPNVIYWNPESAVWMINRSVGKKFGWYYLERYNCHIQ